MLRVTLGVNIVLTGLLAASCGGEDSPGSSGDSGEETTEDTGDEAAEEESGGETPCEPGALVPCECPDGTQGEAECLDDGSGFGVCGPCETPAVCGDNLCELNDEENCATCPEDCGACECDEAPSCEGALVPANNDTHFEELDIFEMTDEAPIDRLRAAVDDHDPALVMVVAALAAPQAGELPQVERLRAIFEGHPQLAARMRGNLARLGVQDLETYRAQGGEPLGPWSSQLQTLDPPPKVAGCGIPQLRMRVASMYVHQESDIVIKDNIYCVVITEAPSGAEVRVTPVSPPLSGGDDYVYALAEGVIWGQMDRIPAPEGNLLVTYNCMEQDSVEGIMNLLDAIGDAAGGLGGIPGVNGWIFPTVGAVADIVSVLLAFEEDDRLFNVSQSIPADMHMAMTQGGWWTVRETGNFNLIDWDWELRMEAWGCAEALPDDPSPG